MSVFTGAGVAIVTPFKDDESIDYEGFAKNIEYQIANGTDAITLGMMAWGVEKGDAVFVPDFTFFSSGECPASEGATCIFVDVDERTYNLDPHKLEEAVKKIVFEDEKVKKYIENGVKKVIFVPKARLLNLVV